MKIISHRGKFSKESAENDFATILLTDSYEPDYIEIDVQLNQSKQAVLTHNNIKYLSTNQQNNLPLLNSLLRQKLKSTLLIELKQNGIAQIILTTIKQQAKVSFTSFHLEDAKIIKNNSGREVFIMQHLHPFGLFNKCTTHSFDGIGVNKHWLIFIPYLYRQCQRHNKKIYIYTINNKLLIKLFNQIFPSAYICTDNTKKIVNY